MKRRKTMADKTLSKQLCEICEIKPKVIQDYELNDIEVYPDFENNNNNFMKLIQLLHKEDFVISNESYPSNVNFIKCLLSDLLDTISCEDNHCWVPSLKRDIRQTKWEI